MDLKQFNETLNNCVKPGTFPVAIKLLRSESEVPEKVRRPVKDLGYQVALCQAIGLARRHGWTLLVGNEDQCCMGGATTMGFSVESPKVSALPAEGQDKSLNRDEYKYMLCAPLHATGFDPDLIAIYLDPAQANRLVQAIVTGTGRQVAAFAPGFVDCGDVIARTFKYGECLFILASGGDRVYGSAQDHEVIVTIPASRIEAVIKGLDDTQKMGMRYPVASEIKHRPALAPFLEIPRK
ncbi:MAG: DUF169 domain-containing protein [Dehalococcoidia bacterium]|nr:DUF169 domain-containing protein [Dehalococcoidia bacterium]MDD5494553.1 DUF169 domain-containing protein [Dehalococcoidia bacterium]